ncbi:MAG TPA: sigma-70 family RNA polymerase sigma factor [Mycobacteriales bacterium]|nr:sigma-70 family RNA polymerase sigma factor [Mycobacteriales bacterium]
MTPPPARDRQWLEALFDAHSTAVLAYAGRRVPAAEVDDVLAEVFTAAWQHRERVPDPALPWLYRTASHHVLHTWRSRSRSDRLLARVHAQPAEVVADHADEVVAQLDQNTRVHAALARLTARDAEVLRLAAWEQLPTDELAYVLGCTPTAAKVRLHRARRRFAGALQPPADHPHPGDALPAREVTP